MTLSTSVYLVTLKYAKDPKYPERIAAGREQLTAFYAFLKEHNGEILCSFLISGTIVVQIADTFAETLKDFDYVIGVCKDYQVSR